MLHFNEQFSRKKMVGDYWFIFLPIDHNIQSCQVLSCQIHHKQDQP